MQHWQRHATNTAGAAVRAVVISLSALLDVTIYPKKAPEARRARAVTSNCSAKAAAPTP